MFKHCSRIVLEYQLKESAPISALIPFVTGVICKRFRVVFWRYRSVGFCHFLWISVHFLDSKKAFVRSKFGLKSAMMITNFGGVFKIFVEMLKMFRCSWRFRYNCLILRYFWILWKFLDFSLSSIKIGELDSTISSAIRGLSQYLHLNIFKDFLSSTSWFILVTSWWLQKLLFCKKSYKFFKLLDFS